MPQERLELPHKLTLDARRQLSITGVTEVVSFDENAVVLHTGLGALTVHGKELQLRQMSLDGGQVAVDGHISALIYAEPKPTGGFLRRLLG